MDIQTFANRYRLRLKRHEAGEPIISGKLGHIYEHDESTLGLMFMPNRPRLWANAKRKLEGAGFTIWQDGDEEGSALFDPTNKAQARLALKVVGAKRKRRASSTQLANLRRPPARRPSSPIETAIPAERLSEGGDGASEVSSPQVCDSSIRLTSTAPLPNSCSSRPAHQRVKTKAQRLRELAARSISLSWPTRSRYGFRWNCMNWSVGLVLDRIGPIAHREKNREGMHEYSGIGIHHP